MKNAFIAQSKKKIFTLFVFCIASNFGLVVKQIRNNIRNIDRDLFITNGNGIMHRPYLAVPGASIRDRSAIRWLVKRIEFIYFVVSKA